MNKDNLHKSLFIYQWIFTSPYSSIFESSPRGYTDAITHTHTPAQSHTNTQSEHMNTYPICCNVSSTQSHMVILSNIQKHTYTHTHTHSNTRSLTHTHTHTHTSLQHRHIHTHTVYINTCPVWRNVSSTNRHTTTARDANTHTNTNTRKLSLSHTHLPQTHV